MHQVGLFKIRGHFGKNLFVGNTDIYGKAEAVPDFVFDGLRGVVGGGEAVLYGGKIQKTLVHAELLDIRADFGQKMHKFTAFLIIKLMVRGFYYKAGTFPKRVYNGLSRYNAVFFGGNGLGKHHAVAAFHVAPHNSRDFAQIGIVAVFKPFEGAPAQVRGINVDMKNNLLHAKSPFPVFIISILSYFLEIFLI